MSENTFGRLGSQGGFEVGRLKISSQSRYSVEAGSAPLDWSRDAFDVECDENRDTPPDRSGTRLRGSDGFPAHESGFGSESFLSDPGGLPERVSGFDEFGSAWPDECVDSLLDTNTTKSVHEGAQGLTAEIALQRQVGVAERCKRAVEGLPSALRGRGEKTLSALAERVENCSSWVRFREWLEGRVTVRSANFCGRHRLCVWCARRRGLRLMREHLRKLVSVVTDRADLVPVMVTLTVKNGPDLRERFNHLSKALQAGSMRRRNSLNGKRGRASEFGKFAGAIWHFEVSRNPSTNEWHPHCHGLVLRDLRQMIDVRKLSAEWFELTGDSSIVDVRMLDSVRECLRLGLSLADGFRDGVLQGRLVKDLVEVSKYPLKVAGLSPGEVVDAYLATRGCRWLREWGGLFGDAEPSELGDDEALGALYRDHVYGWESGRYAVRSVSEWLVPDQHS